MWGRRAARPSRSAETSASGGRRSPLAVFSHRSPRRGHRTNRCCRSSSSPGQNGQWGDGTHPRRNRWARVLVLPRRRIQKNTRTRGGAKFAQLISWWRNAARSVKRKVDVPSPEFLRRPEGDQPAIGGCREAKTTQLSTQVAKLGFRATRDRTETYGEPALTTSDNVASGERQ